MTETPLRLHNYKGEAYCSHGPELLQQLDDLCSQLVQNFLSPAHSFLVSEISSTQFNNLFVTVAPNFLHHPQHKHEHSGLYAFAQVENSLVEVQYVGISKTIRKRFVDHISSKNKSSASWAFLMSRHEGVDNPVSHIPLKQLAMQNMRFTFVQVENPFLRAMAEMYCANKLQSKWNSFDTH